MTVLSFGKIIGLVARAEGTMRAQDNELLTRVGPGTAMGEFMRQYWMPVAKSSEFEAGGAPVRLRIMGEDFLGFRSPDGKVGVVDHQCAHRCASLFYGRNEEGGIRCVYHGWKFDTSGQCVEMPSEPPETDYKEGVRLRAAKVEEKYGAVWVYLGEAETPPPLPYFEFDKVAPEDLTVSFLFRECNWLQALDGDIDTCHVGFLHGGTSKPNDYEPGTIDYYRSMPENRAPKYDAMETPWGAMYCAYRHAGPDKAYHRVGQFLLPFWTMAPAEPMGRISARAWVPVDDTHSMLVVIGSPRPAPVAIRKDGTKPFGLTVSYDYLPTTTDWYGRYRIRENPRNDHLISRDIQRNVNYTGIVGIPTQDQMITESMGPIEDRTKEHLGTSDKMIALTRRILLRHALAHRDSRQVHPTVEDGMLYAHVRCGYMVLDRDIDWLEEYNRQRAEWSSGAALPVAGPPNRVKPVAAAPQDA
jgi:phenylpropionate dioxygenase-like ring-hydroxylating dioxygenase large terminal subunit